MLEFILSIVNKIYAIPDIICFVGYILLFMIVFAETGIFVSFFLPWNSLLITAGLFAAAGKLDIVLLNLLLIPAAIIGDSFGYWFGEKVGKRLFEREKSRIFKKDHLLKAKAFYDRHGGKTIILARFMPLIRTFAPIVAGATDMHYRKFVSYNILGGILWVLAMTMTGYIIGASVPNIEKNIGVLVISVVIISFIPAGIEYLRERKKRHTDIIPA